MKVSISSASIFSRFIGFIQISIDFLGFSTFIGFSPSFFDFFLISLDFSQCVNNNGKPCYKRCTNPCIFAVQHRISRSTVPTCPLFPINTAPGTLKSALYRPKVFQTKYVSIPPHQHHPSSWRTSILSIWLAFTVYCSTSSSTYLRIRLRSGKKRADDELKANLVVPHVNQKANATPKIHISTADFWWSVVDIVEWVHVNLTVDGSKPYEQWYLLP